MKINNKEFLNPQQQLYENTKDIEKLKADYMPVYSYRGLIDSTTQNTLPRSSTNVPEGVNLGWIMDYTGKLFKITDSSTTTLLIDYYAQIKGPKGDTGLGIYKINYNLPTTPGEYDNYTISNINTQGRTLQVGDFIIGNNQMMGIVISIATLTCVVQSLYTIKGIQGKTGPQGPQGIQGPQGEPGQTTIGIEVVAELPTTGTEGVLYFVPKQNSKTGDVYDEYTYTNNNWELLGSAQVDLTNYALKSEIPVINENLIPKAFNTYVLGDNTYSYKEVVANKFKSPNSYYEISGANVSGHGQVAIKTTDGNGTSEAQIQLGNTALYSNKNIAPMSGSTVNLGQANNGFNNLYLDGAIITENNLTKGLILPDTTNFTADKTLATTDQLFSGDYNDLSNKPSLGTAAAADTGTSSGNVPVLDSNGKLSNTVLPAVAITDTFVVANEAAMLALTAQVGDVAVRTDLNKSFILQTDGASTLSHWQELLTPTGGVTDVQIDGTSILSGTVANIITNDGNYDASTNPLITYQNVLDMTNISSAFAVASLNLSDFTSATQSLITADTYEITIDLIGSTQNDYMLLRNNPVGSIVKFISTSTIRVPIDNSTYIESSKATVHNYIIVEISGEEITNPRSAGYVYYKLRSLKTPNIVYNTTQPSNPTNGTIWIKPTN